MLICGVDLKASQANLALVRSTQEGFVHVVCPTKRLILNNDRDVAGLETMKRAIEAFAHQYTVETFVIKARNATGRMASGGISFKIEALFQLSGTPINFVSAQALARFARGNMGGIPETILEYQRDAFLSAALHISAVLEE